VHFYKVDEEMGRLPGAEQLEQLDHTLGNQRSLRLTSFASLILLTGPVKQKKKKPYTLGRLTAAADPTSRPGKNFRFTYDIYLPRTLTKSTTLGT